MSLNDELRGIKGDKRKYLLLRIADVSSSTAMDICSVKRGRYNQWFRQSTSSFVQVHRRLGDLVSEYRIEAIKELRRENQVSAVLVESKIVQRLKEEIESKQYSLIKTLIGRDVLSKLLGDMDSQPSTQMSWEQRSTQVFQQIIQGQPNQGEIDGQVIEAETGQLNQHPQSQLITEG